MGRKRRPSFTRIEYEPQSVKDLLTRMKDTSELVIDLAYAAILFESGEMAEQVRALEDDMDRLLYHIRLNAMLAARTVEDAEQLSGILQVANAAEAISNAAGDIVDVLNSPAASRSFLRPTLDNADEKAYLATLRSGSSLLGRSLGELEMESEAGVDVIAIKRGRRWLYDPDENVHLKEGDVLVLNGVKDGYIYVRECAEAQRVWGSE